MSILQIKQLTASIEDKPILNGVNLALEKGKIHALMGPNGSGKSTLSNVLMGHPGYTVNSGTVTLNDENITELPADERARKGLFLSFQYPNAIPGVTISNFLRTAINAQRADDNKISVAEFRTKLREKMDLLEMKADFTDRYVNDGFSGGEKKRAEILQMLMLDPQVAILDETDSGLDVDALRIVAKGVNAFMNSDKAILIITHYKRILEYIQPDQVSIMIDGKIALQGDGAIVDQLEAKGYGWIEED